METRIARTARKVNDWDSVASEVPPEDSFSLDGARDIDPDEDAFSLEGSVVSSCGMWSVKAAVLYLSEANFRDRITDWLVKYHKEVSALSKKDQALWVKYNTIPDLLTIEMVEPPYVPYDKVEPTGNKELDERVATQTSKLSCAEYMEKVAAEERAAEAEKAKKEEEEKTKKEEEEKAKIEREKKEKLEREKMEKLEQEKKAKKEAEEKAKKEKEEKAKIEQVMKAKIERELMAKMERDMRNTPAPQPTPAPYSGLSASASVPLPELAPVLAPHNRARAHITSAMETHLPEMRELYNLEIMYGTQADAREPVTMEGFASLYESGNYAELPALVATVTENGVEHVVGYGLARPCYGLGFSGHVGEYCAELTVIVHPKIRCRGIGQELLRSMLDSMDAKSALPHLKPRFSFIEVAGGSDEGLAEKKYIGTLVNKFGFQRLGQILDTIKWSDKGPYVQKRLFFYRRCAAFVEAPAKLALPSTVEAVVDGPLEETSFATTRTVEELPDAPAFSSSQMPTYPSSEAPTIANVRMHEAQKVQSYPVQEQEQPRASPPAPAPPVRSMKTAPIAGVQYNLNTGKVPLSHSQFHQQILQLDQVPAVAPSGYHSYTDYRANRKKGRTNVNSNNTGNGNNGRR